MVTFDLNQVLITVLLVALIVLTIVLIVLAANAISTVKKANGILDEGITAIDSAKEKYENIKNLLFGNAIVTKSINAVKFLQSKKNKNKK